MKHRYHSLCAVAAWACLTMQMAGAGSYRGWPAYQGGPESIHYSSLTQVNRDNVKGLQVAWTLDTRDPVPNSEMYCNPLVIGGVIYVLSPKVNLIAADAATGRELWRFDPSNGRRAIGRHRIRGLTYWSDGAQARIFFAARQYLYAVDTKTGKLALSFGNNGRIDLREHLDRDPATQTISLNTPGVVYKDLLIIGSAVSEMLPAAYGDIRAYDVHTGALRWSFHTIPRPGEFGYETWPKEAWQHTGGANSWGGLSLDVKRGIVYAPTGSATFDWYGGDRIGDNLFANSLLALDAKTGKRLWHFQTVHHDSWDRDLPMAPSLVTVTHNGKRVDAVAQPTKSGHLFLFDRVTGQPLFPIEERKVPQGGLAGEQLSPTQPFPVKPAPFTRQAFTEDLITDRTPEAHAAVLAKFKTMHSGEQFVPTSLEGTLMLPGSDGGAEWGGAAWDPETGLLYVNSNDVPWLVRLQERKATSANTSTSGREIYLRECSGCHGADRKGSMEFPSLADIGEHYSRDEVLEFVAQGSGRMPGFRRLGIDGIFAVANYVTSGKDTAVTMGSDSKPAPFELRYPLAALEHLSDPDGYPGIKPPWGTLSAINLNTGEYAWRVPLGEYPALAAKGLKNTGSENYGGAVVTAGGLLFIGATVHDKKFRAFDKRTGELLWETTLPASVHSTPAVYEVNGRQFIVVAAGGGKSESGSGTTYVAFALTKTTGARYGR
jgi:quinoprotein glucose dehydrogenase